MIWVALRCAPAAGRHDLAWLAGLTASLDEIYRFLLRTEVGVHEPERSVDDRTLRLGSAFVNMRYGGAVIDLGTPVRTSAVAAQALTALALLVGRGPKRAAWPNYVRQAWYGDGDRPVAARRAYAWLTRNAVIHVDGGKPDEPMAPAARRSRTEDLPPGVRVAPPFGE